MEAVIQSRLKQGVHPYKLMRELCPVIHERALCNVCEEVIFQNRHLYKQNVQAGKY